MIRIKYKTNIIDFKPLTFNLTNLSFSVLKVNGKFIKYCFVREGFKPYPTQMNVIIIFDWKKHPQTYL